MAELVRAVSDGSANVGLTVTRSVDTVADPWVMIGAHRHVTVETRGERR